MYVCKYKYMHQTKHPPLATKTKYIHNVNEKCQNFSKKKAKYLNICSDDDDDDDTRKSAIFFFKFSS